MKKNLYFIWLPVILVMLVASCQKDVEDDTQNPGGSNTAKTITDVSYGTDAQQKMDVFLPANRSTASTKVMILIHGGGWTSGDKADFASFIDTMKKRLPSYALFNINYRLSANPVNVFPTQENDVKTALEFIFSKSAEYGISDKYVLIGASAGAHLSMLQGYKYSTPVRPKAIVSFFGPSDLIDMYNNPAGGISLLSTLLAGAVGKTPAQDSLLYANSSPVNFINTSSPPTILLHGGLDPLVNASQSVAVKNKLQAAGVTNQYVFYPAGGHGDWNAATYADAFNNIQTFLVANVP